MPLRSPGCSAPSLLAGVLQVTQHPAGCPAPFWSSDDALLIPGTLLAARRPRCCSMYLPLTASSLTVPPSSQLDALLASTGALLAVWSPWLVTAFMMLRWLLATRCHHVYDHSRPSWFLAICWRVGVGHSSVLMIVWCFLGHTAQQAAG